MKISPWFVPIVIIVLIIIGLQGATLFSVPSVTMVFADTGYSPLHTETVIMNVAGVKCVDTAASAGNTLKELEGVISYKAYASYNRVEITYDPDKTSVDKIVETLEGPVFDEESQQFYFHLYTVLSVNGDKIIHQ